MLFRLWLELFLDNRSIVFGFLQFGFRFISLLSSFFFLCFNSFMAFTSPKFLFHLLVLWGNNSIIELSLIFSFCLHVPFLAHIFLLKLFQLICFHRHKVSFFSFFQIVLLVFLSRFLVLHKLLFMLFPKRCFYLINILIILLKLFFLL